MSAYIPARPTTYRGIQMRSRLEARYAAMLDDSAMWWEYEPRAFASQSGQYLPDFYLPAVGKRTTDIYIEVKPTMEKAWEVIPRMQIIWESDPEAELVIFVAQGELVLTATGTDRTWRQQ